MKTHDGLGDPIIDNALYYVQDTRQIVGNCMSFWCPKGAGYTCELDQAGLYTGAQVAGMRAEDRPWPRAYILANVVRHVRVDLLGDADVPREQRAKSEVLLNTENSELP